MFAPCIAACCEESASCPYQQRAQELRHLASQHVDTAEADVYHWSIAVRFVDAGVCGHRGCPNPLFVVRMVACACGVRATVVAAAVHGAQQEAQPGYVRMLVWLTRTHMELCRSHDWLGNAVLFLSFALARDHVRQAKSRGFLRGYTKSDKLGSGGFGVVWSATGIDGISVAVKQASKGCSREWALMCV